MFDRVELRARIDFDADAVDIIDRNHLEACIKGPITFWASTEWGKFDGINMKLNTNGLVHISCSLHKLWRKWREDGKLDNSRMFTITDGIQSIGLLEQITGISMKDAEVLYFEIGMSMQMEKQGDAYISMIDSVDCAKGAKDMYIDANFAKDTQKTSLKTKDMRKVLKIYDKTHEAEDRGRAGVDANMLRVETIYKRQRIKMRDFVRRAWIDPYAMRFRNDWISLRFHQIMRAAPGMKASQIEKARVIKGGGLDAYLANGRRQYQDGAITKKQWETMRTFARSWPELEKNFEMVPTAEEKEYKSKFDRLFNTLFL